MKIKDGIQQMMKSSRYNGRQLSLAMGKHPNFISTTFTKGSTPRVDTLAHMADIMGYKIVLESPSERIEIDPPAHMGSDQ